MTKDGIRELKELEALEEKDDIPVNIEEVDVDGKAKEDKNIVLEPSTLDEENDFFNEEEEEEDYDLDDLEYPEDEMIEEEGEL